VRALEIILAAGAAGLLGVERGGGLQGHLSRPVVAGPLLGWILGDPLGGLLVGAPLELASLGSTRPEGEDPTGLAVFVTTVAVTAGLAAGTGVRGDVAALAFLTSLPLVWIWWLQRRWQGRWGARVDARARELVEAGEVDAALRLHLLPLLLPVVTMAALTVVAATLLGPWLARIHLFLPPLVLWIGTSAWTLLWAAGAGVALRAGRLRGLALLGLAVGAALLWLGGRG
jgi:PTS system mannose-specific IIC component